MKIIKKGEFVLLIEGYKDKKDDNLDIPDRIKRTFNILKPQCSLKQAVNLTAEIHEIKKNNLYKWALSINNKIQIKSIFVCIIDLEF